MQTPPSSPPPAPTSNPPNRQPLELPLDIEEIFGDASSDLRALHEAFTPHTYEEFTADPEILKRLMAEAWPRIIRCKRALRKFMFEAIFKKERPEPHDRPNSSIAATYDKINAAITKMYPRYTSMEPLIQAFFMNHIYFGALSELFAHLYKKRAERHAERFFAAMNMLCAKLPEMNKLKNLVREIPSTHDFFHTHPIVTNDTLNIKPEEMAQLNEKIFAKIAEHGQFPVPLSVTYDNDIARVALFIVSEPIRPDSPEAGSVSAKFTLHDKSHDGLARSAALVEAMRGENLGMVFGVAQPIIEGKMIVLYITRFSGELQSNMMAAEALWTVMGAREYESLRAHILLRYAQLVCDDETFVREFGGFVTEAGEEEKKKSGAGIGGSAPQSDSAPQGGTNHTPQLPIRFFPRSSRGYLKPKSAATRTTDTSGPGAGRVLRGRHTDHHRRLLPAGWQPTEQARTNVRDLGLDLLHHFEVMHEITGAAFVFQDRDLQTQFSGGQKIFSREDLEKEATARGVSLDALLGVLKEQMRERNFTYVSGHEFGDGPTAVRARFRYDLISAAGDDEA